MINQDFPAAITAPVGFLSCRTSTCPADSCEFSSETSHALLAHIIAKHEEKAICPVLAQCPRSAKSLDALLATMREEKGVIMK